MKVQPEIRLLLLEDDMADRLLFTRRLRLEMPLVELVFATRLSEAVKVLQQGTFDAVLSDLSLPDAQGLEAVDQLREAAPHLPIVVLTGLDNEKLALQAVKKGAQDYLVKDHVLGSELGRALRYAIERKQNELEVRRLANYDQTTGISNRSHFKNAVTEALEKAKSQSKSLGLLYCDIHQFGAVNESLGHESGDSILRELAQRLNELSGDFGTVGRLGGDEFGVLIPGNPSRCELEQLAAQLVLELGRPIHRGSQALQLSASIGISLYPDHGQDIDTLLSAADRALKDAKMSWSAPVQFSC